MLGLLGWPDIPCPVLLMLPILGQLAFQAIECFLSPLGLRVPSLRQNFWHLFYGIHSHLLYSNKVCLIGNNTGLLYCFRKGNSRNFTTNCYLENLADLWRKYPIYLDLRYVPSSLNPADFFTRYQFEIRLSVFKCFITFSRPGLCWVCYHLALSHYLDSFSVSQLFYSIGGPIQVEASIGMRAGHPGDSPPLLLEGMGTLFSYFFFLFLIFLSTGGRVRNWSKLVEQG